MIPMKKIAAMITTVAVTTAIAVPAFAGGITTEQAKEIAIRHACVDPASVGYISVHQDWDEDKRECQVNFYVGNTEYICDIDMNTGAIRHFNVDYVGFNW